MKVNKQTDAERRVRILVGKRVTELRQQKKLYVKDLAEQSGINPGALSNIEHGKRSTSIIMLNSICKALGITLYNFFKHEMFDVKI